MIQKNTLVVESTHGRAHQHHPDLRVAISSPRSENPLSPRSAALLAEGALYPTTIHCLVSGVTKVPRPDPPAASPHHTSDISPKVRKDATLQSAHNAAPRRIVLGRPCPQ